MKRKKVTEPRNFGGHFGDKGRSQKKTDCRFGFPDPDLLKEKFSGTPDKTSKSYRAAQFCGAILEARGGRRKKRTADSDSSTTIQ